MFDRLTGALTLSVFVVVYFFCLQVKQHSLVQLVGAIQSALLIVALDES